MGDEYPFVTPSDLTYGAKKVVTERYLSRLGAQKMKGQVLPARAVCYTCIGATIGKMCVTQHPSVSNQQINSVVVNDDLYDPDFIYYALIAKTPEIIPLAGGAATPIINKSAFSQVELLCPPLPTQRKIAAILSAYDDLIDNNTRRVQVLEEMARALYREWFVEFRFPGHDTAEFVEDVQGRRPEGWTWTRLNAFGEFITGKTPPKSSSEYFGKDVLFIKIPDMTGMFTLTTSEKLSIAGSQAQWKKTVPANSILISCIGTLGKLTITTQPSQFNQQINAITPHISQLAYIYFLLESIRKDLEMIGTVGATMPNVSKGKLESIQILNPGSLTIAFSKRVQPLLDGILNLIQRNANLRRTRDLLLPRLISGELDVSTLNISGEGIQVEAEAVV